MPLVVAVLRYVADGPDPRVVHEDVDPAEPRDDVGDRCVHRRRRGDVAGYGGERPRVDVGDVAVEDGDARSSFGEELGRGGSDATGAAGDHRYQVREIAHVHLGSAGAVLVRLTGHVVATGADQEVQVRAGVGLHDVPDIELFPAASRRGEPRHRGGVG